MLKYGHHPRERIRLGDFELDPLSGELRNGQSTVRLQPQPLKVFLALLEKPGEVVGRDELKHQLMPEAEYGDPDHAINLAITKLRSALRDSAEEPRFIETLPRRGYRFIAPTEVVSPASTQAIALPGTRTRDRERKSQWTAVLALLVAVLLAVALIGVVPLLVPLEREADEQPSASERQEVMIGDFTNQTGDPIFGQVLKQALRIQLQQDRSLDILPDAEIAAASRGIDRTRRDLPYEVSMQVCQRANGKALVRGTIANLDPGYLVAVSVVNCTTGDYLEDEQKHAISKAEALSAIEQAGMRLRQNLRRALTAANSNRMLNKFGLPTIKSVAVLPLANLSGDPQQQYFADGMTEQLITDLAKIGALRVISRTSVMQYRQTTKSLPAIGRELNVDAVVEGSISRIEDRVRVTANLVYAPADRHLWAHSYEADMEDVLTLQGDLAREIAEQVRINLSAEERARLTPKRSVRPDALEAYLQGSYAWSGGRYVAGIDYYRQAIAADPNYAQAYVGLCLAYLQMGYGVSSVAPSQAVAETKQAALKALKLDPTLADAQACLAWVKAFSEWDWTGADSAFRRAIELNSNSVHAHRLYSWYLSAMRRHREAITESEIALGIEPASSLARFTVAASYWWAREFRQFTTEAEKLARMDPHNPFANHDLGLVYFQRGAYEESIRHFRNAIADSESPVFYIGLLGCAYARAGRRKQALAIANQLRSASERQYISPYVFALLYSSLGDKQAAFKWLEKAYAERNPTLAFLKVEPQFDSLRSEPQFKSLVRRMNFPQDGD